MPGATARKWRHTPHQPTGTWIRPVKRLAIYLRDGFVCLQCGDDLHHATPSEITLDHRVPRSRGGSNEASNLYTCCRSCNSARGARRARPVDDTVARRARIRRHTCRALRRYLVLAAALSADDRVVTLEEVQALARGYPTVTPVVPR